MNKRGWMSQYFSAISQMFNSIYKKTQDTERFVLAFGAIVVFIGLCIASYLVWDYVENHKAQRDKQAVNCEDYYNEIEILRGKLDSLQSDCIARERNFNKLFHEQDSLLNQKDNEIFNLKLHKNGNF